MPGQTIQDIIRQSAKQHGVPESLALAVAEKESSFNPEAIGPDIPSMPGVKALGTFQLLPSTAKRLGVDHSDHIGNITGGVKYLRELLDASNGDLNLTLKTYGGFKTADPTSYIADINERMAKFGPGAAVSAAAPPLPGSTATRPVATGRASGAGPAATTPPGMDTTDTGWMDPVAIGKGLVQPYDPRTPEGRQNLAGLGGEVALSRVPGLKVIAPEAGAILSTGVKLANTARRTLVPAAGAAIGAGTEAAIEQAVTPRGLGDLITSEPVDSPARVAAEQAAYSLGGQALFWPVRRAAKLVLGGRVGRQADAALKSEAAAAREGGTRASAAMRDKVAEGLEAARILEQANQSAMRGNLHTKIAQARSAATSATGAAEAKGIQQVEAARQAAAAHLAQTELENQSLLQTVTKGYDDLLAHPPSVGGAVEAQRRVLEGPAKRALEMAGQKVDEAAATGPMVNVAPIKKAIQALIAQKRPGVIFGHPPTGALPAGATTSADDAFLSMIESGQINSPDQLTQLPKEIASRMQLPESHPLPGVVGKILSITQDQIPFKDAHQIKRLLDEAVNWDRTAKKHLEAITKGTRTEIRDALSVHEPYNVATSAYAAMVPIYRKGIGKRLSQALMNNPDQAARLLKDNDPIQAATLKELLVTQAAAGGDPKAGQLAWDLVRSHWTYNNLIHGGADKLADRVRATITEHPEFVKVIADDDAGKRVLQNLATIGDAVKAGKQLAEERLAQAKTAGRGVVEGTKATAATDLAAAKARGQDVVTDMRQAAADSLRQGRAAGRERVLEQAKAGRTDVRSIGERARGAVAAATAKQEQLAQSSVTKSTVSGQLADIMRAATLGTGSWFGNLSILRLINGPKSGDLLEWAAYSDQNTRRLTQALMGQLPDQATSALLRDIGAAFNPDAAAQDAAPVRARAAGPVGR